MPRTSIPNTEGDNRQVITYPQDERALANASDHTGRKERFVFVHSADREMHGVYVYVSLYAANVTQATSMFLPGTRRAYNFKRYGKGRNWVTAAIEQAGRDYDCDSVVVVPGSTTEETHLQALFGMTVRRVKAVPRRKYNHRSKMPLDYADSLLFPDRIGQRALLVDDICTSGRTLRWFGTRLQDRGCDVVMFCLGLNLKLTAAAAYGGASVLR